MKKIYILIAVSFFCSSFCFADYKYELGFIAGEPTGISVKQYLENNEAVDAAAAWSFSQKKSLSLHADYLWFREDAVKIGKSSLPLYYGIGARLKLEDESPLVARFPLGLQYFFKKEPLTIFAEIAPVLDLFSGLKLGMNAALGFRVLL